jgi:hypothetical protein
MQHRKPATTVVNGILTIEPGAGSLPRIIYSVISELRAGSMPGLTAIISEPIEPDLYLD